MFPTEKVIRLTPQLKDLAKRHLLVKLFKASPTKVKEDKGLVSWNEVTSDKFKQFRMVSMYCVDLLTLAVGPVKHEITLHSRNAGLFNRIQYEGQFQADIYFTQIESVEVQLQEAKVMLDHGNSQKLFKTGFVVFAENQQISS